MGHGGARKNAGRKPTGRKKVVLYITPHEEAVVKRQIESMRLNDKPKFTSITTK